MPYNFAAESLHTKQLCSRLFLELESENGHKRPLSFLIPFGGLGQGTTFILGSLESVDFLLVIIELLFASFYDGDGTSENRLEIAVSEGVGHFLSLIHI